jgi:hypothetical protein
MNIQELETYCDAEWDRQSRDGWEPLVRRPHFIYRYWNDIAPPAHQLLYIGFTYDFHQRDRAHWKTSPWRRQATRVDVEAHPNRSAALTAEWHAIIDEIPVYNRTHTDVDRWVERHGEYIEYVENRFDPVQDARARAVIDRIMSEMVS